jgi:predicted nucleic-acid-binding protein
VKGIDTNVLVRYLVQDEPLQGRKATAFITRECSADSPGLINRILLCEMVWVLERAYQYPRSQVAQALDRILRTSQFEMEDHEEAWNALHEYQAGGDFADALTAAVNRRLGCEYTVTFDRRAGRNSGFSLL